MDHCSAVLCFVLRVSFGPRLLLGLKDCGRETFPDTAVTYRMKISLFLFSLRVILCCCWGFGVFFLDFFLDSTNVPVAHYWFLRALSMIGMMFHVVANDKSVLLFVWLYDQLQTYKHICALRRELFGLKRKKQTILLFRTPAEIIQIKKIDINMHIYSIYFFSILF